MGFRDRVKFAWRSLRGDDLRAEGKSAMLDEVDKAFNRWQEVRYAYVWDGDPLSPRWLMHFRTGDWAQVVEGDSPAVVLLFSRKKD